MKKSFMRVIKIKTLRDYWEREPNAKVGLQLWYKKIISRRWANSNEVIENFPGADTVGNNRIVFNIRRNDYRLIVKFQYEIQTCYVRFIDTHKEYDKIKDASTI
ncbi:type II toxin-antitoxin system HigB family toxin [Spirosoma foliorum]|uniref:Type II toxin-antitoxin system HigB family toxin n=1 Tax=Spirosoma foliorum TaxID=2710596 RepID=A0A7G5H594_9BACT|nr:type II toxin-antitoxin system HigB family toxin [Spirosoma foliorum]QMW06286.1 type II toxin-antitoxin system HigB family toxin [Spirosoma foliorum]